MYDNDFTHRDALDDIEELLAIRQHSPRFWDADAGELATVDPYEHPSVEIADALAEDGWDDPAVAVEVRELLAEEVHLTPLADTPYGRPTVHHVDELLVDEPTGEEAFADLVLALVPVAVDGSWPAEAAAA